MGNSHSSSGATVVVYTDAPSLVAGNVVTGRVYLSVSKVTQANTLQLSLRGKEKTCVKYETSRTVYRDGSSYTEYDTHYAYDQRILLNIDVPIATFAGAQVMPGQYEFPFSAQLPPQLPTTMYVEEYGSSCEVKYAIYARLHRPGMLKFDVTDKRPIYVSAMPRLRVPTPVWVNPDTKRVRTCCVNKGSMTLGAHVDNGVMSRGDIVGLGLAAVNNSTKTLKHVEVVLREQIDWSASGYSGFAHHHGRHRGWNTYGGGHQAYVVRELARQTMASSEFLGMQKLARKLTRESLAQAEVATAQEVYRQLTAGGRRLQLQISPMARDTYRGGLIQVRHVLSVKFVTSNMFTSSPELLLDITIVPQMDLLTNCTSIPMVMVPPPAQAPTQLPADWHPVQYDSFTLPMEQAHMGVSGGAPQQAGQASQRQQVPSAPPMPAAGPSTMPELLAELERAVNPMDTVSRFASNPESTTALAAMSPQDFAAVVSRVPHAGDQSAAAELLAQKARAAGNDFACAHCVAALEVAAEEARVPLVQRVVALCVDLPAQRSAIEVKLSPFEGMVCAEALSGAGAAAA